MEKNKVIEILEKIVGTDKIEFISGEINGVGTDECRLSENRGSVYGLAIRINGKDDKKTVFDSIKSDNSRIKNIADWQSIGDDFYPLYWGKDINMGIRLYSHTKSMKSTGTLQLNKLKKSLSQYQIIYGAVPCLNCEKHEKTLHDRHKDIMRTSKSTESTDGLQMEDVNIDED